MQPARSVAAFNAFLADRNLRVAGLAVADGIDAMLDFYRDVRAESCDLERDGDMLLYQWGTYDWGTHDADGMHFELDITRQFIVGDGEDDDIWQLSLTFFFAPSPTARAAGAGNRWCHSPSRCDELRAFIRSTSAYAFASAAPVLRVDLDYECAG